MSCLNQQYHKKRLEKEKEEEKKKEKMKEKFAKESRKVYKMLGGLISQQTSRLQAKGIMSDTASVSSNSASPSELGSKRNLIKTLDEATDSSLKRTRTSSVPPVNNRSVIVMDNQCHLIINVTLVKLV